MKEITKPELNESTEMKFHDQWAGSIDVSEVEVDALFESGSCPENRKIIKWMGELRGKRILEVGCGLGEASVYFAKKGAIVTATDISQGMLDFTQRLAARHGVKLETIRVSANDVSRIPDGAYDCIYAANLLHHVDIDTFISQVRAKLRPEGTAYFWDPVLYNPIIQVYRRMAGGMRTPDEHPLTTKDLRLIRSKFSSVEVRFYWFSALVVFLKYFVVNRIHPSKARYWKKVITDAPRVGHWLDRMHCLDRVLFSWIPGVRWLGWNIVIRAQGRNSSKDSDQRTQT